MPKQKNIDIVTDLKEKVTKSKAVYLTDYRGLTHKQLEELHKQMRTVDADFVVVKNSLLKLSFDPTYELGATKLIGPTAALLAYGDEISPLKELYKFIKVNTIPKITLGFVGSEKYDEVQITRLAKLPSKQELYGQVVSRVSGPMYGLVYALNGNIVKLVTVLSRIQK